MNMLDFNFTEVTPDEINKGIAMRILTVRKRRKISQVKLSEKSGVSLGSVKQFERTGEVSLLSLTKIALALNIEQELKQLFSNIPYLSLEEIAQQVQNCVQEELCFYFSNSANR